MNTYTTRITKHTTVMTQLQSRSQLVPNNSQFNFKTTTNSFLKNRLDFHTKSIQFSNIFRKFRVIVEKEGSAQKGERNFMDQQR